MIVSFRLEFFINQKKRLYSSAILTSYLSGEQYCKITSIIPFYFLPEKEDSNEFPTDIGSSVYRCVICTNIPLGRGQVKNPSTLITSMLKYNFERSKKFT